MDKTKWKQHLQSIRERLSYLNEAEEADLDDPVEVEERIIYHTGAPDYGEKDGLKEKLQRRRSYRWHVRIAVIALVLLAAVGFFLYNQLHTFRDYIITDSEENTVSSGTVYVAAGKAFFRYNADGVSYVTRSNEVQWSITYNMQAPIAELCGTTMVIAEQQGNQIYVVDEDGLVGSFETVLPILKVRVSSQGVVAAVLEDDDITWVNLYQADGDVIVSDRTTLSDSGYPLDVALSPDGQKMAVSYLEIEEGVLGSNVVFYHFGSAGNAADDYVVSSERFAERVMPQIYFTTSTQAVAVADDGFVVFRGGTAPEKTSETWFGQEIVSTFHDEDQIGFLFESETGETEYRLELYNYRGKQKVLSELDADFEEIKLQNGQILMYSSSSISVFTTSGRCRFQSKYEKEVLDVFYFSEYRRYLVITRDSFDAIRIC